MSGTLSRGWWNRAGYEQALGNDVLFDRQPDDQIGDGRKLAVQRLDNASTRSPRRKRLSVLDNVAGQAPLSNAWTDTTGASLLDLRARRPTATAVIVAAPDRLLTDQLTAAVRRRRQPHGRSDLTSR